MYKQGYAVLSDLLCILGLVNLKTEWLLKARVAVITQNISAA